MRKAIAMAVVLVVLVTIVGSQTPRFFLLINLQNLTRQIGLHGIYALGAGMVIIAGGIDLSLGSWIALSGVLMIQLLVRFGLPVYAVLPLVMATSMLVGFIHGVLITKVRMQPFVVTLSGLLMYRGFARFFTGDDVQRVGLGHDGLKFLAKGFFLGLPMPIWITLGATILCGIFLHTLRQGRYLYAIGRNPEAAWLSGISVHGYQILTYVISTSLAGVAGILFALYTGSVQPANMGNAYELYGIAAAVLGGCSLRGGEGTAIGILLGACVISLLRNSIVLLGISTFLEFVIIGGVILIGVMTDELLRGRGASWKRGV